MLHLSCFPFKEKTFQSLKKSNRRNKANELGPRPDKLTDPFSGFWLLVHQSSAFDANSTFTSYYNLKIDSKNI